jgi:hypothetical protein
VRRTRSGGGKCGVERWGGSFIANGGDCDDDSEVSVEKHDEAYCVLQLCVVGWVGTHKVVVYGA